MALTLTPQQQASIEVSGDTSDPIPVNVSDPIIVTVQPAITAGAYTAGDALGGLGTIAAAALAAGGSGTITKIVVIDDANQRVPIDFIFFNQTFGATVDNAPFDPTDADMENFIGFVDFLTTDYSQFFDNSGGCKASGTRMPFDYTLVAAGTSLFYQAVVRGTPTFANVADLTFKFELRREIA